MSEPKQGMRLVAGAAIIAIAIAIGGAVALVQNGADTDTVAAGATNDGSTTNGSVTGDGSETTVAGGGAGENGAGENPDSTAFDAGDGATTSSTPESGSDSSQPDATTATTAPTTGGTAAEGPIDVAIGNAVIGAWSNGAWRETPLEPPPYDGTVFTYFENSFIDRTAGASTRPFCEFIPDGPGWELDIDVSGEPLGVSNLSWDPRSSEARPTEISPERAVSISNVLADAGLGGITPSIDAATILDIDNDGANEVILEAQSGTPEFYGSRVGDYSTIVVRWVNEAEEVEEVVVALHATTGNEPGADPSPDAPEGVISVFSTFYELVGTADLNGDGDLELVIGFSGWEFWGYQVVEISGRNVDVVLEISCGV